MIRLINDMTFYDSRTGAIADTCPIPVEQAKKNTMAYGILTAHNTSGNDEKLKIKFDAMASHDITYVGIIQTARASGLEKFPIPYVLTNCHNSLCAVGGTINEDDHIFGLSAAKKYGGIYVPAHEAVIHSYMREMMSGCGKMILGSDSHTRYGALGTLAMGEGGPELVKQLLCRTYDIDRPAVVGVYLTGKPKAGVGPQDAALALIGAVFKNGFVKNCVMEFIGDGIAGLPIEFRNGVDVMTTETACLSSIWMTDEVTKAYYDEHGRSGDFRYLSPKDIAAYDRMIVLDLSKLEPMIALPFHPSNTFTIRELNACAKDIIAEAAPGLIDKVTDKGILAQQGVIAGCAGGTFDNLCAAADILRNGSIPDNFTVSAYPASQPVFMELCRNGVAAELMADGVTVRSAFCGPCFGAGDVPANGALSLRHSTRNFPNREGSKPSDGQSAFVALMDARSIAATAINGGIITGADTLDIEYTAYKSNFDDTPYKNRVYFGYGKADPEAELKFGPNITDWPEMPELSENILLGVASVIYDEVTTTDELIPSGETSSYRSNPLRLAEFALSRKDPAYVGRAKNIVRNGVPDFVRAAGVEDVEVGSAVCALKPGDGSAREQAASCQRVLGGLVNIACEYATKRYRSNLINWGMIPFLYDGENGRLPAQVGDYIYVPNVKSRLAAGETTFPAKVISEDGSSNEIMLKIAPLTDDEKDII
ncbi:MAG: hydratase, partial [Clostridia bacterium]|nr:hydratase [Clostridia bacterium]